MNSPRMTVPAHAAVMQLFHEQAVTISKSGSRVSIQCDNGDDANAVFDWLFNIGGDMNSADEIESLLAMLKRFAVRGEQLWDDVNFRDGYKKIPSGDIVDCRKLLRKFGVTDFKE